jgi:hypothetical protein
LGERTVITTGVIIHEFLRGFRDDGGCAQAARMMSALKYLPFGGKRNMLRYLGLKIVREKPRARFLHPFALEPADGDVVSAGRRGGKEP